MSTLDWFFDSIEPHSLAYTNPEFAFLAHFDGDGPKLITSRLVLQPLTRHQENREIEVGKFYGCRISLNSLNMRGKLLKNCCTVGCDLPRGR